jgi:replicative DNA helicase/DNA-binding transcriptional ArsR family regulator
MSSSYNAKKTLEYDLIPPHSDELERSILGCMISNRNCLYSGVQALKGEDFYNSDNENAFKVIKKELDYGTEVDEVIIAKRLEGIIEVPKNFVAELLGCVTSPSYFNSQIKTLKDLTSKRNVRGASYRVINLIKENRLVGEEFKQEALRIISEALNSNGENFYSQHIENDLLRRNFDFNPQHIKDVLSKEEELIDWIWDGYIAKGSLILLAGSPKVGKSTFAYHMVNNVAKGVNFLGSPVSKTSVLILAMEEREQDVRRRLNSLEAHSEEIQIHFGLLSIERLDEVKRFVVSNNVGLILIDTLGKIWNVADENDAAQAEKAILPFLQLARETNAAVLLVHHLRKSQGNDGMDIRGSTALFASVDNAITLKRYSESKNERLIETIGRWDCFSEVISLNGNGYERLGSKSEVKRSAQKRQILDCLSDTPSSPDDISKLIDLSPNVISAVLKRLYEEGEVNRTGLGVKGSSHFLYKAMNSFSTYRKNSVEKEIKSLTNHTPQRGYNIP